MPLYSADRGSGDFSQNLAYAATLAADVWLGFNDKFVAKRLLALCYTDVWRVRYRKLPCSDVRLVSRRFNRYTYPRQKMYSSIIL